MSTNFGSMVTWSLGSERVMGRQLRQVLERVQHLIIVFHYNILLNNLNKQDFVHNFDAEVGGFNLHFKIKRCAGLSGFFLLLTEPGSDGLFVSVFTFYLTCEQN
jgi:hypothetical protein